VESWAQRQRKSKHDQLKQTENNMNQANYTHKPRKQKTTK
jgi:hypothetical protein